MHLRTPEKEKSGPRFTASSPGAVQVTQKAQGFPFCTRANWPKEAGSNSWVSPGETFSDLKTP